MSFTQFMRFLQPPECVKFFLRFLRIFVWKYEPKLCNFYAWKQFALRMLFFCFFGKWLKSWMNCSTVLCKSKARFRNFYPQNFWFLCFKDFWYFFRGFYLNFVANSPWVDWLQYKKVHIRFSHLEGKKQKQINSRRMRKGQRGKKL